MSNNSAHDDISIVVGSDLESISDEDGRNVFMLIKEMEESEELGSATFIRQDIILAIEDTDLSVNLSSSMPVNNGWLDGPIGQYLNDSQSTCLSVTDIESLKNGDFDIEISLWEEPDSVSLSRFLQQLEVYEIGRPSTVARMIDGLITDSSLISISTERDEVKMTDEGKRMYELLRQHLGTVATVQWNLDLMSLLALVETGDLSPEVPILMVFEELYGREARIDIQHLKWSDPDTLYQSISDTDEGYGKIAKIRSK